MRSRRTFAEILKGAGTDIASEYEALKRFVFSDSEYISSFGEEVSLYDLIRASFLDMDIRGTCRSIDEFNARYGFNYANESITASPDLDDFIGFCEYIYNLCDSYLKHFENDYSTIRSIRCGFAYTSARRAMEQVIRVVDKIGFRIAEDSGYAVLLEDSPISHRVSELLPDPAAHNVAMYHHHSLAGNLDGKRAILQELARELEGARSDLKQVNQNLENELFYALNSFDIRHANTAPSSSSYKEWIAELDDEALEQLYDDTYDLCLCAIIELQAMDGMKRIRSIRNSC